MQGEGHGLATNALGSANGWPGRIDALSRAGLDQDDIGFLRANGGERLFPRGFRDDLRTGKQRVA
jgi:hypothetical protein